MDGWAEQERTMRLRDMIDWSIVRAHWAEHADAIPDDATIAGLGRDKASFRGLAARQSLTTLYTAAVNQPFLDEICELPALERLWLGWPVTAHDLSGLRRLTRLRTLKIDSPRNATDFTPLAEIPSLTRLFVENAKHMRDLEWLDHFRVDRRRSTARKMVRFN